MERRERGTRGRQGAVGAEEAAQADGEERAGEEGAARPSGRAPLHVAKSRAIVARPLLSSTPRLVSSRSARRRARVCPAVRPRSLRRLAARVAALLAGWHALLRFGPALPEARGVAFGMPAIRIDGNDPLAIYAAVRRAREIAHG